jgi:thioredoxin-dependent peroxiredoxin
MLAINTKAPSFSLCDQDGKEVSLDSFLGRYVVIYFYPKDNTPGCTIEACKIRDGYDKLQQYAVILGISSDNVERHKKFVDKYSLPFLLLADIDREVIKKYEAGGLFIKRITYIVDPKGFIVKAYPKVTPANHADELVKDLEDLHNESKKS